MEKQTTLTFRWSFIVSADFKLLVQEIFYLVDSDEHLESSNQSLNQMISVQFIASMNKTDRVS